MTGVMTRRDVLALGASLSALGLAGAPATAQQRFFRIGTGGTGGTYYPVGGMIANAISTPTINVSAVATNGAVANVNGIVGGSMESGFSQADVNAWAYTATGIYQGKPKVEELRAIANLYPESVHVVVKKGAGIKSLADLKGKRVSIDEPGSGTIVNARALLAAYGVGEKDIRPEYLKQVQSAEKFKDGTLDAYFQGGVVDFNHPDWFVDGQVAVTRPVSCPPPPACLSRTARGPGSTSRPASPCSVGISK